ncbi:MAG: glycosyltransferase family 4 protein [Pseudobutyrivibrio ruminis]|uniref:hypothetical protein n=1 Tax=Pseudobutyrivibrio ruminis TaxID=46206 RepID=UPI0026EF56DF|nr:hypothetical protein [Pseudobutyrivibrio ruminis]MBE5913518.1 glycosyltransferase family 4 protein [Pseudobutyrivibrio ruminis]
MKKILIVFSERIPSVEIICNLLQNFKKDVAIDIKERLIVECTKADIEWSDTILVIRPFDISMVGILRAAKKSNREIIVYLDDDLLHLPQIFSSGLRKLCSTVLYRMNRYALKEALEICDVFWGSSEYMVNKYRDYVATTRCICTDACVSMVNMKQYNETMDDEINILYAASSDHFIEVNKYIIPALNNLGPKYKNLKFTCIGIRKEKISECAVNIEVYPWFEDYNEYYKFILQKNFDIGLAPVQQTEFYRCKYYNKYFEYVLQGIVGIYTNDYPFKAVVEDGVNGLLSDNTVEGWTSKIEYAILHKAHNRQMVERAQNDCREKFNIRSICKDLKEKLPELYVVDRSEYLAVKFRPNVVFNNIRKYAVWLVESYEHVKRKE